MAKGIVNFTATSRYLRPAPATATGGRGAPLKKHIISKISNKKKHPKRQVAALGLCCCCWSCCQGRGDPAHTPQSPTVLEGRAEFKRI